MSAPFDQESIRTVVERDIPALEQSSNEELLAAIGSIPLDPVFTNVRSPQEIAEYSIPGFGLARLGEKFINTNQHVREVVCRNKSSFSGLIDVRNVSALVVVILPALGITAVAAAPPVAVMALAVFILRLGLDEYCRGYEGTNS
jgi:hypothetical protein